MKAYENISRIYLTKRLPVIIRIDGRAFHTLTRGFDRPFDTVFSRSMWDTAAELCKEIGGAKLAYTQSDEISILLTNDDNLETQPWFDNNLQKLVSVAASTATKEFNNIFDWYWINNDPDGELRLAYSRASGEATFDARAFVLPHDEVCNYFIWRQQDAVRNSIQMAAQSVYSHKELQGKNQNDLQEMLFQKGINWNNYGPWHKRGVCVIKKFAEEQATGEEQARLHWVVDMNIPIFTQDRGYIENALKGNQNDT